MYTSKYVLLWYVSLGACQPERLAGTTGFEGWYGPGICKVVEDIVWVVGKGGK
jgi:hypothetical protein